MDTSIEEQIMEKQLFDHIMENKLFDTEINNVLQLDNRAKNGLRANKITTIEQLCSYSYHDLLSKRLIGEGTATQIEREMNRQGYSLKK